ncbi:MAG: hypothetical protein JW774_01830 [Candidatus Aureabacteria bacterium]|nr:hypothetical protein [Candidatus Auribacterota bacterium]
MNRAGIIACIIGLSFVTGLYLFFRYRKRHADEAILASPELTDGKKISYSQLIREEEGKRMFPSHVPRKIVWTGSAALLACLIIISGLFYWKHVIDSRVIINRIISEPPYYFAVINGMANTEGAELRVGSRKVKIEKVLPSFVVLIVDGNMKKIQITMPDQEVDL